ncbi:hypothetical protein BC937DRAFT_92563 [Endogone sp. FLAS-F59071]|nr:hypothetical protein BC937DRAFT_92563 [Endogone sp. FLAS-F59071]|eukprot:RUS15341.1 hypothetical protein BC937DRAFT_92563 [Endogone sp. FLAS-F59071]
MPDILVFSDFDGTISLQGVVAVLASFSSSLSGYCSLSFPFHPSLRYRLRRHRRSTMLWIRAQARGRPRRHGREDDFQVNLYGSSKLQQWVEITAGLESMWDAVTLTWDEAWNELLHDVKADPGFSDFYDYCKSHDIPVKVVSRCVSTCSHSSNIDRHACGLRPMIECILVNFIGDRARELEIISNEGVIEGRKWKIVWRDET